MEMGTTTLDMVIGGMRGITVGLTSSLFHEKRLGTLLRGQRLPVPPQLTDQSGLLYHVQTDI